MYKYELHCNLALIFISCSTAWQTHSLNIQVVEPLVRFVRNTHFNLYCELRAVCINFRACSVPHVLRQYPAKIQALAQNLP